MAKHMWWGAGAAALAIAGSAGSYIAFFSGEVHTESLCGTPANTPEQIATHVETLVVGTVGEQRITPDASGDSAVSLSTLTVEKSLKGTAPATLNLAQGVVKKPDGTYGTTEALNEALRPGNRYAVGVLAEEREGGGRWVWGAERADGPAADAKWQSAVDAREPLPEATCGDDVSGR
ncbi:hypothetical protein [Streptomyces sp. NBC_01244]|uniref:hypothetical protein n=1 Tax=Streptomyces sp. NBC_01244 TaxID=2903797 RepID=UPI002E1304A1|nr:hypothetical protein OG247_44190 [Streptomyces sp. NBC_01244]